MDNNICWFCNANEATENSSYKIALKHHKNKKDIKIVEIKRCTECEKKHRTSNLLSTSMYLLELVMVAVLYFVFELEFFYVVAIYIILMKILTSASKGIRRKISAPAKAECDVDQHKDVSIAVADGYIEKRRF